jgi:hypothetical protein
MTLEAIYMDNIDNRQHADQSRSGRSKHDDRRRPLDGEEARGGLGSLKSDWSESFSGTTQGNARLQWVYEYCKSFAVGVCTSFVRWRERVMTPEGGDECFFRGVGFEDASS